MDIKTRVLVSTLVNAIFGIGIVALFEIKDPIIAVLAASVAWAVIAAIIHMS